MIYALSALWSATERIFLLGAPTACLVGVLPWLLITYEASPDLATLKKADWVCTASNTTYVQSGGVLIPSESCIEYRRK